MNKRRQKFHLFILSGKPQNKILHTLKRPLLHNPESKIPWKALDILEPHENLFFVKAIVIGNGIDGQFGSLEIKLQGIRDVVAAGIVEHNVEKDIRVMGFKIS